MPNAAVNGHPTMAPTAKHKVALVARCTPVGVEVAGWNQNEAASIVVYIENVEGKKATISPRPSANSPVPELHIPADSNKENKTYRPTR